MLKMTSKGGPLVVLVAVLSIGQSLWQAENARAATVIPPPYLVLIPSGGAPDVAEMGSQVHVFGRDFCPDVQQCSPITISIGNDIVPDRVVLRDLMANQDGTFTAAFTVNVPFPWRWIVTATQTTPTSTLSASVPLNVPLGDPREEAVGIQGIAHSPSPASVPVGTPFQLNAVPDAFAPTLGATTSGGGDGVRPSKSLGLWDTVGTPAARQHSVAAHTFEVSDLGIDPAVMEFPPDVAYDGRSVAVDVSTQNDAIAIAASESGGLWKTTDSGATWSHLDGLPTFRMSDVKFAPSNDQIVIATAWADSHAVNSGGTWRSTDGGATWTKPATVDPTPNYGCPVLFNAWGIAFDPTNNDVFVGTDCGVAVSHDLGATWTHVVPDSSSPNYAVYSVFAQPNGSGGSIVDTCGADGHHRSSDGGTNWTPTSSNTLPACPFIGVHNIAASPLEPNVLFAAIDNNSLYESDDGGSTWTNLNPNQGSSREPWVTTHLSADGNSGHIDVYFGSGLHTIRQTCTNTGGPGLRCSTSWNAVSVDHDDHNGLAFSTANNCAQYIVTDGGIHGTSDCGATWHVIGNGSGGYHALQVYEMNGQVHPGHTDLYFGTQDNCLWASGDNGGTWPNNVCWEGFFIQTTHDSPTDSGQTITFTACSGCSNLVSGAHFSSVGNWNNPPGGGGNPFIVEPSVYVQWSAPNPPTNQLYLSTDTGGTWNAVTGATTTLQLIDHPFISGPPASPTVYQEVMRPGNRVGLIKITGVRSGSATISNADSGLNNIGFWSMGQGTFRWAQVFTVDPNNPAHLMAADIGFNAMMVSTDGGSTWSPDIQLTHLVTSFGKFQFGQPYTTDPGLTTEAHTIAFDPSNGNRILVGTEQAGIMASLDGGATWSVLPGSDSVPAVSSFFFDEVQNDVMASSYGRGLWELDLSQRATTLAYTGDTNEDYNDSTTLSATLTDTNSAQPLGAVSVTFTIGSQSCTATTDSSGNASCSFVLNQTPGNTNVVASFAGSGLQQAASTTTPYTINREDTAVAYTGDTTADYHDPATLTAIVTDPTDSLPISGLSVTFTLGSQSCSATSDGTGHASCVLTPNQAAGNYTLTAAFAGDSFYLPSGTSATFVITREETTLSYTGDTVIANNTAANMSGVLLEDGTVPIAGRTVVFTLGTGGSAQTCSGVTSGTGVAACTISPVSQPLGPGVVSGAFAGDAFYLPSSASASTIIFAFLERGSFVIGDKNSANGTAVTFWSSVWNAVNALSGGAAPSSFKGFASKPATQPPACGGTWTASPADSAKPPVTLPLYMGVVVSKTVTKSGSTISGDVPLIVVVQTNAGYAPDAGHAGTGTVIATYCHT
jgi:hypothetical protein